VGHLRRLRPKVDLARLLDHPLVICNIECCGIRSGMDLDFASADTVIVPDGVLGMDRSNDVLRLVTVFYAAVLLESAAARSEEPPESARNAAPAIYAREESLQETLLATRLRYRAWLQEQPAARDALTFDAWLATPPLPRDQQETLLGPDTSGDLNAKLPDGRPLWTPQQGLSDGKLGRIPTGPGKIALGLFRTIRAQRAVRLTIGVGGGDHLEVWLNGRRVASGDTHLSSGRYGTGRRYDNTRIDQLLVTLDLQPGENRLLLRVTLGSDPSFHFSSSPNPVPKLWQYVRQDFPTEQNPLLDLAHASWFDSQGWFAAWDIKREEQLLEQLSVDCSDAGDTLRVALKALKQPGSSPDDRAWLDLCVKGSVLATLQRDLGRLRAAVSELGRSHAADYPADELLASLDDYERRLVAQAGQRFDPSDDATRGLMAEMHDMRRRMLVDLNPLLRDAEILFVQRYTYDSKHYYDDFQQVRRFGGNLCVLSLADGTVRKVAPELDGGVFDRYDLSFDAKRIVFGYRRPKPEGFRLWEIGVDGSGLRQVTHPPADEEQRIARYGTTTHGQGFYSSLGYHFWTDDLHPCYLPDGGLCFASTRSEHGVLCTASHVLACTSLFRIDADGGGMRPISYGALSEFTPVMMDDGRILYNRWEYVYKGIAAIQPLWVTRPDGSGNEEFYGNTITNPGVFWQARQVPGRPYLAVCTGCGHEPLGVGSILLVDLDKGKRNPAAMTSLTPNVRTKGLRGLYQLRNGVWREDIYGPFYCDPYPLSDRFFLVSCNPDKRYNDETAYGIHLLDAFGNRVPIYHDPEIASWQPMLLRPRTKPPVLPSLASEPPGGESLASVYLNDVYRGLDGVERGTVKYLRVMEQVPKPWAAEVDPLRDEDRIADNFGGHVAVSWHSHIWVAVLRGIVRVEEDGSASFQVPAERNLFFQALDKDFMEIQRMRTFVNFLPGEARSCIGCHEHRTQAPAPRLTLASCKEPTVLSAQPGEVAPRALDYATDVQPILDRHCVRCHDGTKPEAKPDLRGELTTHFNRSYENLMKGQWLNTIREWNGLDYSMMHAPAVPPYTYGSHASRLVKHLKKGHRKVKLARGEWIKLVTWIDCGAPYYGSYFGRRNLAYRGDPDFRPVPTVDSACGIPPVYPELTPPAPLPAQLLAWWRLDDAGLDLAADSSGQGRAAKAVNVAPGEGRNGRAARRFDGTGYVEGGNLGDHEAVSVALWVKPDSLGHRWNPLFFCNDGKVGAVHFSLLRDGTPNVAINMGKWNWRHRKANASLADGGWHHVALVCDARRNGEARFYIDGKPVGKGRLSLALRLDLNAFRIGAYNGWQDRPANNFHGQIADVRVYSGTLTDEDAARLIRETAPGG